MLSLPIKLHFHGRDNKQAKVDYICLCRSTEQETMEINTSILGSAILTNMLKSFQKISIIP